MPDDKISELPLVPSGTPSKATDEAVVNFRNPDGSFTTMRDTFAKMKAFFSGDKENTGVAQTLIDSHEEQLNPHPQYINSVLNLYDTYKYFRQGQNTLIEVPQMGKVYTFNVNTDPYVTFDHQWLIDNELLGQYIFSIFNNSSTSNVTLLCGPNTYLNTFNNTSDTSVEIKPKQSALFYRESNGGSPLTYTVFLNKETSNGGGGGGIPEPTVDGNNVRTKSGSTLSWSQTELVSTTEKGVWDGKQSKPLETTINQNAAITIADFTTQEKAINGLTKTWKIVGDSVNPLTLPSTWLQKNTLLFDNTIVNYIVAEVVNGAVLYGIHNTNVNGTDTQAPQTLGVTTTTDGQKILVTFDEIVQGTSNFTYSSGTIASQTLIGNVAELIPSPPLLSGTTLGTLSGGGTISDLNGNFITPFSSRAIDNILAANVASLQGSTPVQGTASKLQLATGAGGTDSPVTISMWVFVSASTSQKIVAAFSHLYVWIDQNRRAGVTMSNGAIYIAKQTSGFLTLGWNYLTVTVDSSKSATGINIYVNNTLSNGSVGSLGTYTGGQVSSYVGIGGATIEHLIDEVVIWNQVLSITDRNNTYNSGQVVDMRTRNLYVANSNNMLFYCKFDNNITDLSPNPVTLTGTPTYNTSRP